MWKRCVVLLMLYAWQGCGGEVLVNLVEPRLTYSAPVPWPYQTEYWKLFDYDISTYHDVVGKTTGATNRRMPRVELEIQKPYEIMPTNYRMTMAAHVSPADYPSSWRVKGSKPAASYNFDLVQVTGAVFENGVYEGSLPKQIGLDRLLFLFDDADVVTLAEVEVLGPRSALDALWPYGNYPCAQRLAVITSAKGPKKVFSRSENVVTRKELRVVFNPSQRRDKHTTFYFDGAKPVIVGARLPELPMVQEVSVDASDLDHYGVEKVVLQGSFCQPRCRKVRSKGWVWLGAGKPLDEASRVTNGPRIFVKNPGEYKAYRLKFIPRIGHNRRPKATIFGISFLGCPA